MSLATRGPGYIGSNVVAALNDAGRANAVVCDTLGQDGKWRNLAKWQLLDIVPPGELMGWLGGRRLEAILHLGDNGNRRRPRDRVQFRTIHATGARRTAGRCSTLCRRRLMATDRSDWGRREG
jgi:nucleoside-diphosphate-sugar epimerase